MENNNDIAIMKGDIVEIKVRLGKVEHNLESLSSKMDGMEKNFGIKMDLKLSALENRMLTWIFVLFAGTIASIIVPIFLKYYVKIISITSC